MDTPKKTTYLSIALFAIGVIFIFAIYPLMVYWPSGWQWVPNQHEYEQMILAVYATLGFFLIRASRKPLKHLSLIWFTAWSSLAHGGIMAYQAITDNHEIGHLLGDVPALILIFVVLVWLTPWTTEIE